MPLTYIRLLYVVETVFHTARAGTPCLLVRGSGKASDMISDAVLVRYSENHPAYVKHRSALQRQLWEFALLCGLDESSADSSGIHDWETVITRIRQEIWYLENFRSKFFGEHVAAFDQSHILREKAKQLVTEGQEYGYAILESKRVVDDRKIFVKCFTILRQAFEAGEFIL